MRREVALVTLEAVPPLRFTYALVDPTTGNVRYVGKSSTGMFEPKRYFYEARNDSKKDRRYVHRAIRKMFDSGIEPEIVILEEFTNDAVDDVLNESEVRLIRLFRSLGHPLTNLTAGGDGMSNPSPETRRKIGDASRGKKHSQKTIAKMRLAKLGKKKSEETKCKMRAHKKTEEHRRKLSEAKIGKKLNEATRKKMSISHLGKKLSLEHAKRVGPSSKPLVCLNHGKVFLSAKEAASFYGVSRSGVTNTANGRLESICGLRFAYVLPDVSKNLHSNRVQVRAIDVGTTDR